LAGKEYLVLGMMSGSSLDGLDLAICRFKLDYSAGFKVEDWEILAAETDAYPPLWQARLRSGTALPGRELWRLHTDLGRWFGQRASAFLAKHPALKPTLAGSHGHTLFHDPGQHSTTQIGDGAAIAQELGITTVTEFRGADIAAGGQGAPLAPLADKYLFPDYNAFLNLGGIANLSMRRPDGNYLAGDISGCCQVLDRLAAREGLRYDAGGQLAARGTFSPALAAKLVLPYHDRPYPKSLDNAWVTDHLWHLINERTYTTADCLHTFTMWLAGKIVKDFGLLGAVAGAVEGEKSKVLVTGGGARNSFLMEQLRTAQEAAGLELEFVAADESTGDFKEAALIALAALMRQEAVPNALASATGAVQDTINGAVYSAQAKRDS
jgi:anhydro-N-acetylmuramic acid kinase